MKNLYISLGVLIIALGIFLAGDHHGRQVMQLKIEKANKQALLDKQKHQEEVDGITSHFTKVIADLNVQRAADIERLRNRADRMSKAAQAKCQGATGAELSRPDASFLVREAARAERLREALKACYSYADSLQR